MIFDDIIVDVDHAYPDFNTELLVNFRRDQTELMPQYLDTLFRDAIWFDGKLTYKSYRVLSPEERLKVSMDPKVIGTNIIQTEFSTMRHCVYIFEYEGEEMYMHIQLPYLHQQAMEINGTKFFPLLVVVEQGIHVIGNKVAIKVSRAPLTFYRNKVISATSISGVTYRDNLITAKLHLGKNSNAKNTPLVLYHLCTMGLSKTLEFYNIDTSYFQITDQPQEQENVTIFKLKNRLYLHVHAKDMHKVFKRRVILSLLHIFDKSPKFTSDVFTQDNTIYFKLVLGKFTYRPTEPALLLRQVDEHLRTNDLFLDPFAKNMLTSLKIPNDNMNDLLRHIFLNIDKWLVRNPADFYQKKFGSIAHLLEDFNQKINTKQFKLSRNHSGISRSTIAGFMKSCSTIKWQRPNRLFKVMADECNDNWLISVGNKWVMVFDTMERQRGGQSRKTQVPTIAVLAHPSLISVTSLIAVPEKSSLTSGTVNPYINVDSTTHFIKPIVGAKEFKGVFS